MSTTPSAAVLNLLREHPGQVMSPTEIATETGLSTAQVSAALQHLDRQYKQVTNPARGEWIWKDGEPESLLPSEIPASFETLSPYGTRGVVLRDETGGIWLAVPMLPAGDIES